MKTGLTIFFISFFCAHPLLAQERIIEEGEHRGFIVNEGRQILKVNRIRPGQTIQVFLTPQWFEEIKGRVEWRLEDQDGVSLRVGRQTNPEAETTFLEWTSNSQPKPSAYVIKVQGTGGEYAGEILGQYSLQVFLWDQNDGDSGTDAPETYEKAILLPVAEPGNYFFQENFLSGTADLCDLFKIHLKPNHSLTLRAFPTQWQGRGPKGHVRWELLNKSFRPLKGGTCPFPQTTSFLAKVFHPKIKGDPKPALFYLMVKIEGEVSIIYTLQAEIKEGR